MHIRRWGAAALLTMTVAACSKPVPGPATLPPLTPSAIATTAGGTSGESTSPAPRATAESPLVTPPPPSSSAALSPTPVPAGDKSETAAVASAIHAMQTFVNAENALDIAPAKAVSAPSCNCLDVVTHAILTLKSKKLRRVGDPPTRFASKVVARSAGVISVQLSYDIRPFKFVDQNGKIVQPVDAGHLSEVYQMNYIGGRWLVYYVTYNAA